MENYYENILAIFAVGFGLLLVAVFVFLYRRKRIPVFCGLSAFLASFMMYVVASTFSCLAADSFYENIDGGQVLYFIVGNLSALFLILWVYLAYKPKVRYGKNRKYFDRETSVSVLLSVISIGVVGVFLFPNIPGLGRLVYTLGDQSLFLAWGLACHRWYRRKVSALNIILLSIAGVLVVYSIFFAGFSRKPLLAFFVIPLVVFYYSGMRIKSLWQFLILAVPVAFVGLMFLSTWTSVRVSTLQEGRGLSLGQTTELRFDKFLDGLESKNSIRFLVSSIGDNSTSIALAAVENYLGEDASIETDPFNTLFFIVANPVPRAFWENKPSSMGTMFPRDLGIWETKGYVNWGTNFIGHSAHEGGFHIIIFYALIIGFLLKRFDHYVEFNFRDPLCVAILGAAFVRMLGFVRGDFGVFTIGFLGFFLVFCLARFIRRRLDPAKQ